MRTRSSFPPDALDVDPDERDEVPPGCLDGE